MQCVWYAYHPLTDNELHPSSWEMRRDAVRFVLFPLPGAWVNNRVLIGYWAKGDTNES